MTENEIKTMMNLVDTINGEINRMCVTNELTELDKMECYAVANIRRLSILRKKYAFSYKNKAKENKNNVNNI